jgi:AcrR family transcriptional regulator
VPRPKQRTPELRDHVLSAAVGLLAREGVAGFTARSVAREAETSTPAVYELFGDKGGLIRELFFEGFRRLQGHLETFVESADPRADVIQLVQLYRGFIRENQVLAEVMFAHPFTDFEASRSELRAGGSVRSFVVARVRRCIDAGLLHGDESDIALVLITLAQGLAVAENASRLGTTKGSIDRRWTLAVNAVLDGLSPSPT